jgi:uncharacterized peroxidase-related enzyme
MTQPIAKRFPTPSIDKLPDDIRTRLLAVQEKSGFIPNVFLTLAYRPDEFRAFFAYHDALMEKDGGLTKAEREMIVVATSSANQCLYCVIAHGAILRMPGQEPADIRSDRRQLPQGGYHAAPESHARFRDEGEHPRRTGISEADFSAVASQGFSDDDIWDIAAISAFFALSNRMANVTGMRPNDEFYMDGAIAEITLGRDSHFRD